MSLGLPGASRPSRPSAASFSVVAAALALTALDAAKPLVIDDTVYVAIARQILVRPLDPYGFELYWDQDPEPAFDVLAPPLLPYWIAGSMALFGDRPMLWKLWLFPFAWVLAGSLFPSPVGSRRRCSG
jgi:hypothetical protein